MAFLEQLLGNLIHGAILGSVYGLATMGLSFIFGVMKIVNVGHGAFIMIGAFTAYFMFVLYAIPPVAATSLAIILGLALGFIIFYTVIRRLIEAPELASLLATFGIGIFLEELAKALWGPDYRGYSWNVGKLDLGVTLVSVSKIYALISSFVIVFVLYLLIQKTRIGSAIRAVTEDREGAMVCGVNVTRIFAISFTIGIVLTVVSGVFVTLFVPVGINPYMGGEYTLKAFVSAVLGGLGSAWGAYIGGFIFGLLENGSFTLLGAIPGVEPFNMTRFVAFTMLLIILLIKPTGLMGR